MRPSVSRFFFIFWIFHFFDLNCCTISCNIAKKVFEPILHLGGLSFFRSFFDFLVFDFFFFFLIFSFSLPLFLLLLFFLFLIFFVLQPNDQSSFWRHCEHQRSSFFLHVAVGTSFLCNWMRNLSVSCFLSLELTLSNSSS